MQVTQPPLLFNLFLHANKEKDENENSLQRDSAPLPPPKNKTSLNDFWIRVCFLQPHFPVADLTHKNSENFPSQASKPTHFPSHQSLKDSRLPTSCPILVQKMKQEVSNFTFCNWEVATLFHLQTSYQLSKKTRKAYKKDVFTTSTTKLH